MLSDEARLKRLQAVGVHPYGTVQQAEHSDGAWDQWLGGRGQQVTKQDAVNLLKSWYHAVL